MTISSILSKIPSLLKPEAVHVRGLLSWVSSANHYSQTDAIDKQSSHGLIHSEVDLKLYTYFNLWDCREGVYYPTIKY